jgi:hypothetical protein
LTNSDGCDSDDNNGSRNKTANAKIASLKAELQASLAQPLIARGVSVRYITSGNVRIADQLITGVREYRAAGVRSFIDKILTLHDRPSNDVGFEEHRGRRIVVEKEDTEKD